MELLSNLVYILIGFIAGYFANKGDMQKKGSIIRQKVESVVKRQRRSIEPGAYRINDPEKIAARDNPNADSEKGMKKTLDRIFQVPEGQIYH